MGWRHDDSQARRLNGLRLSVTGGPWVPAGRGAYRQTITIAETDAASASEWEVSGLPQSCVLVSIKGQLTAGTGTTIGPYELGAATGWSSNTMDDLGTSSIAAAAFMADQTALILPIGSGGSLYGRSKVDAAADNSITTQLVLELGER